MDNPLSGDGVGTPSSSIESKPQRASPSGGGISRRKFVLSAAGVALAAGAFPSIIPASALGRNGAVAPSNRLSVGVIGCGPQGLGDMSNFLNQADCRVVGGM